MSEAVKHLFVTQDIDKTFNMIEDECGDIFWGYGHRDAPEFTEEVNRWLIHACGIADPDDLFALSQPVEHLWAKFKNDEQFDLVDPIGTGPDVFQVTRLMV